MTTKQTGNLLLIAAIGWALFCLSLFFKWDDALLAIGTFVSGVVPVCLGFVSLVFYLSRSASNPYLGRLLKPHCSKCEAAGLPYTIECTSMIKERWGGNPSEVADDYQVRGSLLRTAMCSRGHRIAVQARAAGARFSLAH